MNKDLVLFYLLGSIKVSMLG